MRTDELDALEQAFGVTLPAEYRATMLAYPFPADSDAAEWSMPDDAARLHEHNTLARQPSSRKEPWPRTAFVIGEDGSEAVYVLDLSRQPAVVQEFSLETGHFTDLAPDWPAWLTRLREVQRELDEDEEFQRERYRTKKWWQFWIRPYP